MGVPNRLPVAPMPSTSLRQGRQRSSSACEPWRNYIRLWLRQRRGRRIACSYSDGDHAEPSVGSIPQSPRAVSGRPMREMEHWSWSSSAASSATPFADKAWGTSLPRLPATWARASRRPTVLIAWPVTCGTIPRRCGPNLRLGTCRLPPLPNRTGRICSPTCTPCSSSSLRPRSGAGSGYSRASAAPTATHSRKLRPRAVRPLRTGPTWTIPWCWSISCGITLRP